MRLSSSLKSQAERALLDGVVNRRLSPSRLPQLLCSAVLSLPLLAASAAPLDPAASVVPEFRELPQTREEAIRWQTDLRDRLADLLGLETIAAREAPLEVRGLTQETDAGDHWRSSFELRTTEDHWMPVYRLRPKEPRYEEIVLAFHGHGHGRDEVAGVAETKEREARIERLHYDFGAGAANRGYLTFVPDMRGFGLRSLPGADSCRRLAASAAAAGISLKGLHTHDAMRLIDYLAEQEDTRDRPVGALGLSGGGGSVMWLAAMDERVEFAVISAYLKAYREDKAGCPCNLVPGQLQLAGRGEIAALIPPRRLFVQNGSNDSGCPVPLAREAMKPPAVLADLLGSPAPHLEIHPDGHEWSDAEVWDWIASAP